MRSNYFFAEENRGELNCDRSSFVAGKTSAAGNTCRIVKAVNTACGKNDLPQPASLIFFGRPTKNRSGISRPAF